MRLLPRLTVSVQNMNVLSQYVSFIGSSVDGQLAGIAGYIRVGSVLQKQLDAVQVSRSRRIIQDRVSIAGLGIHITP